MSGMLKTCMDHIFEKKKRFMIDELNFLERDNAGAEVEFTYPECETYSSLAFVHFKPVHMNRLIRKIMYSIQLFVCTCAILP